MTGRVVGPVLEARGLGAGYPAHPDVLVGSDLTLQPGVTALLGANGCGKSTLLRCLSGALRPTAGEVRRDGETLAYGRRALVRHRQQVQLVLQDPDDQIFSADVAADVSFGPMNLGLDEPTVRARVAEALAALEITHLADRPVHHLSFGSRKRVALAGAVAMRPKVLLLDEPTAGLDPAGTTALLATVRRLVAAGTTILLSTHDVALAWAWADDCAVLSDGRVTQGRVAEVLSRADVLRPASLEPPWQARVLLAAGLDPAAPGERPRDAAAVVDRLRHAPAPGARTPPASRPGAGAS